MFVLSAVVGYSAAVYVPSELEAVEGNSGSLIPFSAILVGETNVS
jgi:hypothetical protein